MTRADVDFLHTLPGLQRLVLKWPHSLFPVRGLTRLRSLMVETDNDRPDLDCEALGGLRRLQQLQLQSVQGSKLGNLIALSQLTALTGLSLNLEWDSLPTSFPVGLKATLSGLHGLQELVISANYTAAQPWHTVFQQMQQLTCLSVSAAALPACSMLPQLAVLSLEFYQGGPASLQPVTALTGLTALELVDLGYGTSVSGQDSLSHLPRLRHLSLDGWSLHEDLPHLFGRISSTCVTSLRLRSHTTGGQSWQCSDCSSLQQLELLAELGCAYVLNSEELPLQPLTLLVYGELSRVKVSVDMICSGRVQVQQVAERPRHLGSMEGHWD